MERVTLEQVENAIKEFYAGGATQLGAHQWLTKVNTAPEMWEISWRLLEKEDSTTEMLFFSAKTLHSKITSSWSEVPIAERENLRQKLIELLVRFSVGPKVVLTRLLMASCSYIIHSILEAQSNAVTVFLSAMIPSGAQAPVLLLQLLTLLPEEMQAANCTNQQRNVLREELKRSVPNVLQLVKDVLDANMNSNDVGEPCVDALRCLLTWIQFGVTLDELEPVVPSVLRSVAFPATAESALEVLSAMLVETGCSTKFPETTYRVFAQILSLECLLDEAERTGATDMCRSIYGALIPIGDANSKNLLLWLCGPQDRREAVCKFINLVIRCSSAPGHFPTDEVYSDQAFGFWYNLQDELSTMSPEDSQQCEVVLSPVYRSLIEIFLTKSTYARDYESWSSDEKESFRCYRQDIGDAFIHCHGVLGDDLVKILDEHLHGTAGRYQASQGTEWEALEAVLHAYGHISECLCREPSIGQVPGFFGYLPLLQTASNRVMASTTLTTIGSYADWLSFNPSFIHTIVPILLPALAIPELAAPASLALKDIAQECRDSLRPYNDDILNHCMGALKSGKLKSSECVRLMYPVGKILASLPVETIIAYLDPLLTPFITDMQCLLQQAPSPVIKHGLIVHLRMFAMLCFSLDMNENRQEDEDTSTGDASREPRGEKRKSEGQKVQQPAYLILQQLLPTLKVVVQRWADDCSVIEAVCNLVKKTLSTLGDDLGPLVADLVTMTSAMYQMSPHPPVLDLSKHLVILYGGDQPAHKAALSAFVAQICTATLIAFETSPNVRELTDTLEAFLLLLAQTLKKRPTLLLENSSLNHPAIFQLAILGLGFPEQGTLKAAASFLGQFISQAKENPVFYGVVTGSGQYLVQCLLKYIGGETARTNLPQLAEVFLALNKRFGDSLSRWMEVALAVDGFPTPLPNIQQKDQFRSAVLRERVNKRKLTEVVVDFALICRGLINTEYGRQTAAQLIEES